MRGRYQIRLTMHPMAAERRPPGRRLGRRAVVALLGAAAILFVGLTSGVVAVSLATASACGGSSPLDAPVAAARPPTTPVTGHPVAVATAGDDATVFVSLSAWDAGDPNGIQVFHRDRDGLHHVAIIPLHSAVAGLAMSPDGRVLLAALNDRVAVLNAARAATGDLGGLVGYVPTGSGAGTTSIAVATRRYVITADGAAGRLSVFDLGRLEAGDFGPSAQVATVDVDLGPAGLAVSPDGRYVYVASQVQRPVLRLGLSDWLYGALTTAGLPRRAGTLSVIDLKLVELNPSGSVIARVPAGCAPARVAAAPDGKSVWVTAQQSNELLAFPTDRLLAGRAVAPSARVRVGAAPAALRLVKDGRYALVAATRRPGDAAAPETVTVVDTTAALAGRSAVRSTVSVGGLPRDIGLTGDQRMAYVTNSGTSTLTSLDLTSLLG